MLRQRILTSIVGIPLLLLTIIFKTPWFPIAVVCLSLIAGYEFYRIVREMEVKPKVYFALIIILLLVLSPFCPVAYTKSLILTFAVIVTLIWHIVTAKDITAYRDWAWTMAGIVYIGWTLSYWNALTIIPYGYSWIVWTIAVVILCDVSAFFVGRAWGKHPLAPLISPRKTWEGAIGGIAGSIITSIITGFILPLFSMALPVPWWHLVIAAILISIVGQFSDLAESLLKRNAHVKDSGKLLPGHGGMLDRIDSFIFVGPVIFYYAAYLTWG